LPINQSSFNGSTPSAWRRLRDALADVLPAWALALALSATLVAGGRRLPQPLAAEGLWVALLVFGLPLLMGLVLAVRWLFAASPEHHDRGESGD
jgi:hypothetical protein